MSQNDNQLHCAADKGALAVANKADWCKTDLGFNKQLPTIYGENHDVVRQSSITDDHISRKKTQRYEGGDSDGESVDERSIDPSILASIGVAPEYRGKNIYIYIFFDQLLYEY